MRAIALSIDKERWKRIFEKDEQVLLSEKPLAVWSIQGFIRDLLPYGQARNRLSGRVEKVTAKDAERRSDMMKYPVTDALAGIRRGSKW